MCSSSLEPGCSLRGITPVIRHARIVTAALVIPWALALASGARAIPPAGTWSDRAPLERGGYSAIHDPVRDRMVLFGGYHPAGDVYPRNETWTLPLAPGGSWSRSATIGSPPAWGPAGALYDPVRDRMILLHGGGQMASGRSRWGP